MHDPLVVAFDIRLPVPLKTSPTFKKIPGGKHWYFSKRWYFQFGQRAWRCPILVTVWHREPGGHDSGEVCKHYRRYETIDGWKTKTLKSWRFHVHHWHIQVPALQALRRRLLTRCAWCGGKSNRRDPVNISHSWDGPRGRWWQGEPGLFHSYCSGVVGAKKQCLCDNPLTQDGSMYADCLLCGQRRYGPMDPTRLAINRLYATVEDGRRPSDDVRQRIKALVAERKEANQ
jgi:hypothetical protein